MSFAATFCKGRFLRIPSRLLSKSNPPRCGLVCGCRLESCSNTKVAAFLVTPRPLCCGAFPERSLAGNAERGIYADSHPAWPRSLLAAMLWVGWGKTSSSSILDRSCGAELCLGFWRGDAFGHADSFCEEALKKAFPMGQKGAPILTQPKGVLGPQRLPYTCRGREDGPRWKSCLYGRCLPVCC